MQGSDIFDNIVDSNESDTEQDEIVFETNEEDLEQKKNDFGGNQINRYGFNHHTKTKRENNDLSDDDSIVFKWSATCDFQQCGILTSVDPDKPLQPPFNLRNAKWCSVISWRLIEYPRD